MALEEEVAANFGRFSSEWRRELTQTIRELDSSEESFVRSYSRLTSLHAWRTYVIEPMVPTDAAKFFIEAQNDSLSSHVFARCGSWRASLKSLRSCIENVFFCQYYKDHPIELRLWANGKHRMAFAECLLYFRQHPDLQGFERNLAGLDRLEREYAVLSRAVHGSAPSFRMTLEDGTTNLWSSTPARLGAWETREKLVVLGLNLFLVAVYRSILAGTGLPGLRQAISVNISSDDLRLRLKEQFQVAIPGSSFPQSAPAGDALP